MLKKKFLIVEKIRECFVWIRWLIQTKRLSQQSAFWGICNPSHTQGNRSEDSVKRTHAFHPDLYPLHQKVHSTQLSVTGKQQIPGSTLSLKAFLLILGANSSPASWEASPSSERTLFIPTNSTLIPLPSIQMPPILHGPIQKPNQCACTSQRDPLTKTIV